MSEVTTAAIATTPKSTTPTTFRSISGFALPSVHHNNSPLLNSVLSLKLVPPPCAVLLVLARVISKHPATPTDRPIVVFNTGRPPGTTSATSRRRGAIHNDQVEMQWRWSCSVKKPTRLLATSEVFALCIQCAADRLQILSFHGMLPLESAKMAVFARRARACRQSEERRSKCAKG